MRVLFFLLLVTASFSSSAETLVTKDFKLNIDRKCQEGEVDCQNIELTIIDLANGSIKDQGVGETMHTKCKDGAPCRFLGYKVISGAMTYFIYQDGTFEAYMDSKQDPFYKEQGVWQD